MGASVGGTPILRRQPMSYASGSHTVFHHRYHIVWINKYRYKVLEGALRERIRTIIRQVCKELGVQIVSGVLSREHIHMFVEIPPHIAVSDFVRRVKGRSSHRVQMEFPELRKRYWGRHFWARGYFCTTSGAGSYSDVRASAGIRAKDCLADRSARPRGNSPRANRRAFSGADRVTRDRALGSPRLIADQGTTTAAPSKRPARRSA